MKPIKKVILLLLPAMLLFTTINSQELANIADPRLQIKLPDAQGDSLTLASLKGKVVLLDFWASWCLPCRASNKKLAKLYPKYREQGFEIFGVSVDEEKADWMKAIRKDKITWIQVNDSGGNMGKTIMDWNVTVIPTTFLINREGNVVAIDLEGKRLEEEIRRLLNE